MLAGVLQRAISMQLPNNPVSEVGMLPLPCQGTRHSISHDGGAADLEMKNSARLQAANNSWCARICLWNGRSKGGDLQPHQQHRGKSALASRLQHWMSGA